MKEFVFSVVFMAVFLLIAYLLVIAPTLRALGYAL